MPMAVRSIGIFSVIKRIKVRTKMMETITMAMEDAS
jgi:hypothetical protein